MRGIHSRLQLTSLLPVVCRPQEEFYGKEVIVADREMVEMVRLLYAPQCLRPASGLQQWCRAAMGCS